MTTEISPSPTLFDRSRIVAAVVQTIRAIGEDPDREGLIDTPRRIADMYAEIFGGLNEDPRAHLEVGFEEGHQEMVILKDIPFFSMCEHHFLPFHGVAHLGYIPQGRVVGISKLARVVDILARRPQLQERLTSQIADTIDEVLVPEGVGVVVKAEHLCMTMRGIKKPGSHVVTSAVRGTLRTRSATRAEFMALIER
ncbi:MAG TPA: GTP cyclohydrolase I FolE [Dehalococcoidia bacterium]|nr:GTP cyclohydrolase I FolE [Dehalococcoidia bacterium]